MPGRSPAATDPSAAPLPAALTAGVALTAGAALPAATRAPSRPRRSRWLPALAVAVVALTGCTQRLPLAPGCRGSRSGTSSPEPPDHCFFFPSGLAVDPLGDLLYVTNPNSDLSFSGGTLVAVDLPRHERAVQCFRDFGYGAGAGDPQRCGKSACTAIRATLTADSGIGEVTTLDQQIRAQGESPAAYDRCYCERDALDLNIINCESQRFILRDRTIKTGNFSGDIALLAEDPLDYATAPPDPGSHHGDELRRALYLPVRGDPSLTFVDVRRRLVLRPESRLEPGNEDPTRMTMTCGGSDRDCDRDHRVQQTPLGDELLVVQDDPSQGTLPRLLLPHEPFGVVLDTGCKDLAHQYLRYTDHLDRDGQEVGVGSPLAVPGPACKVAGKFNRHVYRSLVMTHLSSGDVSTFNLNGPPALAALQARARGAQPGAYSDDRPEGPGAPVLADVRNLGFLTDGTGRQGAFALAPRRRGDRGQPWYATSRYSGQINSFRLGDSRVPLLAPPGYDTTDADAYLSAYRSDPARAPRLYMPVEGPAVIPGLVFSIAGGFPMDIPTIRQVDVRDLIFEPDGNRAFMVLARPPAVAVIDTTLDERASPPGTPRNRVLRAANLGPGPSHAALSRAPALGGGAMDPRPLRTLLYVAQFTSGEVAVVDPEAGSLLTTIFVGRGPTAVALNYGGDGDGGHIDACADPYVSPARPGVRCPAGDPLRQKAPRAYVTSYLDNAVAVIDLDPTSPTYHRVVSRIGLPAPKVQ